MKKKYLESLQMTISNSYWQKSEHHLDLYQLNLLSSLILFTCLFLLYLNVHKKQAFKCLFKIPL